MKLLFATDGSDFALTALDGFIRIVHLFDGMPEIVLINVQLSLPNPGVIALLGKETMAQYYNDQSEDALAGARKRLEQIPLAFGIEKRVGDPAEEIVHVAELEHCEMIAMGTHGCTAFMNLLMGSVATKVLATSKVPVLFIR